MESRSLDALDGMLTTTPAGVAPEYPGMIRSSKFWIKHPPAQPAGGGGDTTTPFQVSGRTPRFYDVAMYDAIMLAAVAINNCLKDGCRPVGHGYDEVMPYFRAASIDGISGPTSIKVGSNDPEGRLFSVRVGKNPASRGQSGAYTINEVAVTSTHAPDLQVCTFNNIGESCGDRAAPPGIVKCFASSATSIDVEWEAAKSTSTELLLTGYRVTAFSNGDQVVAIVNRTSETRVTFTREAVNQGLKYGVRYSVQVEAQYANAAFTSKATTCIVPQDGLPCIPPNTDASTTNRGYGIAVLNSKGGLNCPCVPSSKVFDSLVRESYIDKRGVMSISGIPQPLYPADRNGQDGATYGGDACMRHDQNLPPDCSDDKGNPLAGAPLWCKLKWCWVDPANCDVVSAESTFFQSSNLYYSYETCGAKDVYTGFNPSICGCQITEFHTKGMPPAVDDPPLQPDGSTEGPARDWKCEPCIEGAQCAGGTMVTVKVRPGWFVVRRVSQKTGAEKRPKLWRCPGGSAACPGGASIAKAMGVLMVKAEARACENITISTKDLQQHSQCQCNSGGTGMLCQTCKSADSVGGRDWVVVRGNGRGCIECSIDSAEARTLVSATFFGFLVLVLCIVLGWWRYTRPSVMEERFIEAFRGIEDLGGKIVATRFFGVEIGSGITKDIFVAAVIRRCGGSHGGDGTVEASTKAHALKLWSKLDEDDVRNELRMNHSNAAAVCVTCLMCVYVSMMSNAVTGRYTVQEAPFLIHFTSRFPHSCQNYYPRMDR